MIFKEKFWRFKCYPFLLLQWLHTVNCILFSPLFEQTYFGKSLESAWYMIPNCNIKDFMQVLLYLHNGFSLNWLQKHLLPRASITAKYNVPHWKHWSPSGLKIAKWYNDMCALEDLERILHDWKTLSFMGFQQEHDW